jgi:K+-transporting ATPase KdpF subunit
MVMLISTAFVDILRHSEASGSRAATPEIWQPLHRFYTPQVKFSPVFPSAPIVSRSGSNAPLRRWPTATLINSRSNHGSCVYSRHHRLFPVDAGTGRGLRQIGKKKMTWAYVLSGVVSLALLVYLVIALIRAEDL